MPIDFTPDSCDGPILEISGKAPYSATPDPFPYPGANFDDYKLADVTYSVCIPETFFAQLRQPEPATPVPSSDDSSGLTILVVAALVAQLVINVIAIRKPQLRQR
ncbi:MAG: hypothetical protein EBR48_00820 [bacterium]|nr:hypothetical protein [Candidatus Aquidulcis frankliniae]